MSYPSDEDFRACATTPAEIRKERSRLRRLKEKPCRQHSDYWPLVGAHRRAIHAVEQRDEALKKAETVIAKLYVAMKRQGWEKGPTVNEATEAAHDWFYSRHGYEGPAASAALTKLGGGES